MNIKDVEAMRNELLDRMVEDFKEGYTAAVASQDEGAPKVVRAILDEIGIDEGAIGEYYFTPNSEDDEIQIFNAILTMSDSVPEDNLPALYETMSYINFVIPVGCFAYDKDHNFLTFRLSVSMPITFDKEAVYSMMNIAVGNSASVVDSFMNVLIKVSNGEFTVGEVKGILGGH